MHLATLTCRFYCLKKVNELIECFPICYYCKPEGKGLSLHLLITTRALFYKLPTDMRAVRVTIPVRKFHKFRCYHYNTGPLG
jgi:hypothetical protein